MLYRRNKSVSTIEYANNQFTSSMSDTDFVWGRLAWSHGIISYLILPKSPVAGELPLGRSVAWFTANKIAFMFLSKCAVW